MRCSNCGTNGPTVAIAYAIVTRENDEQVCDPCANALIRAYPSVWVRRNEKENVEGIYL